MADLCALSGYSRDQIRGLLDRLPMYSTRSSTPRIASCYTAQDLVLVGLCCVLEVRCSLKREAVVVLAPHIAKELAQPRAVTPSARLVLTFDPPSATYQEKLEDIQEGLVVALRPVFDQVHSYLLPDPSFRHGLQHQRDLALGPVAWAQTSAVATTGKRGNRVKTALKG